MLSDSMRVFVTGSVTVDMKDSCCGRRYAGNRKL
jgi:hypothetical protein